MKKKTLTLLCLIFITGYNLFSQSKINLSDIGYGTTIYIFNGFRPTLIKCNSDGDTNIDDVNKNIKLTPPPNSTFYVYKKIEVDSQTKYIIQFRKWVTRKNVFTNKSQLLDNLKKAKTYNYIFSANEQSDFQTKAKSLDDKKTIVDDLDKEAYFLIDEKDLSDYVYVYNPKPKYEFSYGTITYLARIRPRVDTVPGRWSSDLNLGITAGIRKNFTENFGISLLAGFSYTKINLDSISTRGAVRSSLDKPAFTPSINLLVTYKMFSLGVGLGWDWVNEDSKEASSWVYNKRQFWSLGFGINIFNSSNSDKKTNSSDQ